MRLFRFQAEHNPVYSQFIQYLNIHTDKVASMYEIPFMPISFFKNQKVKTGQWNEAVYFTSSGTTGSTTSHHYLPESEFYLNHSRKCFEYFFGPLTHYHFLALMPSYLEQKNSSLISMMKGFMHASGSKSSGFYLHEYEKLLADIDMLQKNGERKIILWGVSYALLELAEKYGPDLSSCIIIETGGMKGRRKELTRDELHNALRSGLHVGKVYSEYGMTELLSQSYTKGGNIFYAPPFMKILIRDVLDPFEKKLVNRTGGVNIIDFANAHSIAFIETEDLGKVYADGSFEIVGRLDNSDVRGCNLLVET